MPSLDNKRPSEGPEGPNKIRKTSSTRTGQACDRCKVRKIRCDARPGGCSPCLQNNNECKTTDRITGRATSRGHTEALENENVNLRMYVMELQQQLKQNNIEPGPPPAPPMSAPAYQQQPQGYTQGYTEWELAEAAGYSHDRLGQLHKGERQGSMGSLLPEFRAGCVGDNYLGVASENNWLSPIEGTSLALFGTKIDLADFMPPEPNPDATAMSYQTFLTHAFGKVKMQTPDLPAYEQCKQFAEWYFRSVQVFIPILHKPDFFHLLTRIYHESYQPTPAETVMVHTVLAVMYFQYSARNDSEETRRMSFSHFHYSLTFIPELIASHKLEDLQALGLICTQLRNQPRPGAAWMFTNTVLGLAIESGLHRSAKAWPSSGVEQDPHLVEMRKRVFWTILEVHTLISGNLGRPMALRPEDFDIEIPEPVNDDTAEEPSVTKWKKCSFRAGIEGFKLLRILMQVYSTIYAVRSTSGSYDLNVRQIEKDLLAYQEQVPAELSGGSQSIAEDRISALYLQLSVSECQLLLHHPATCRAVSPHTAAANLDICLDVSKKMLKTASQLKQLKSLDTTLYYATDFLAAVFTTIFAYTEKKNQLSPSDMQQLRHDMDTWLDVLGPVGQMLGTGLRLQEAMASIIDRHLGEISRHIAAQTASAAVNAAANAGAAGETSSYDPPSDYYSTPYQTYPAPPQQQQQVPLGVPTTAATFDSTAWRHFAENMINGIGTDASAVPLTVAPGGYAPAGYMSAGNVNVGVGTNGHAHTAHPAAATFGGMQMPDSKAEWPMVMYSQMPPAANGANGNDAANLG